MQIEVLFPTLIGIAQADDATILAIDQEILAQEQKIKQMLSHTWGDNVLTTSTPKMISSQAPAYTS